MPSTVIKVIIIDIWINGRVSKKHIIQFALNAKEDGQEKWKQIGQKKENSKNTTADH